MTDILEACVSELLADDDVREKLAAANGVYTEQAPRGAPMPYLVLRLEGEQGHYHFSGVSAIEDPDVEVEAWGRTAKEAVELAEAAKAKLSGFRGTFGGVFVHGAFLRSRRLESVTPSDGGEVGPRVVTLKFDFWRRTT